MARLDAEMLDQILTTLREYAEKNLPPAKLLEIELGHEFPEKVMKDLYDPGQIGLHLLTIPEEFGGPRRRRLRHLPGLRGDGRDRPRASRPASSPPSSAPTRSTSGRRRSRRPTGSASWPSTGSSTPTARPSPRPAATSGALATTAAPVEENGTVVGYRIIGPQAVDQQRRRRRPLHDPRQRAGRADAGSWWTGAPRASRPASPRTSTASAPRNTAALFLENVYVPADRLIGQVEGKGLVQAQAVFGYTRLMVAAFGLGAGWEARAARHPLLAGARAGRRARSARSRATPTS